MYVTTQVQALSNSNLDAHFFLDKKHIAPPRLVTYIFFIRQNQNEKEEEDGRDNPLHPAQALPSQSTQCCPTKFHPLSLVSSLNS